MILFLYAIVYIIGAAAIAIKFVKAQYSMHIILFVLFSMHILLQGVR